ncbi:hypothetical protein [Eubacterium sp.]|uniref:hypothetical protein n=1 Tax=Eubacterium sp. TaxID=142586 RepID=UPI0025890953|nr:hypothetical protein [Eubacterium sp.]MCR5368913.1 hypothetical protein [Eubacterium sp.]
MKSRSVGSLIKIFQKNSEMRMPERTAYKVLATIAVLGIMIPCTLVVGFISYVMTGALIEADSPGGGMLFEMQILSAFSMIFGILVIFSVLFFSSDREHFVTLPIPSHHLMMSRFIYAYVAESIMEFMILIAVFVGYFIAIIKNVGVWKALNPVSIISSLLGVALIPLIPMIYCAIFSLILMAGLSKVKSTKVFYRMSTLFLLIFAAIFVYSLRGIGEINMENYVNSLGSGDNLFLKTLNIIFFPVPWLSKAVGEGSIIFLLLYIIGNAGLMIILYFLGKKIYQKGLYTAASLGSSKKADIKEKDITSSSQFKASLFKELRVILRTKAFSGNCAFINILWPIGAWMLFHFTGDKGSMKSFIKMYVLGKERAEMIMIIVMISLGFIATALNSLASTAFTREGQHLELIKYIPVPFKTQLYAKAFVCFIFTYPMLLITDIIICYYLHAGVMAGIYYALLMLFAHVISIFVGMSLDSSAPYKDWSDEYSALRGNLNVFFNMAIMMVIAIGVALIGLLMYEVLLLPNRLFAIAMFVILVGVTIRMCFIGPRIIIENMKKLN